MMNRKKVQLYAVSLTLVAFVLMGRSTISHAQPQAPQASTQILADRLVGSDPFIEGLELLAANNSALITQYYQFAGQRVFPLDLSQPAFSNLNVMYIISSNQENWHNYWPRSIWEFRDGATVVFQFSQGIEDSLSDAEEIIPALNSWMGTTLDVLYGAEAAGTTTLFYWGYMSTQNHSNFIIQEFYDVISSTSGTDGYLDFLTDEVIAAAPVSVVATGVVKKDADWIPLAVASFIQEDGIVIDVNDVHNMSIGSAFDYTGSIAPASGAWFSKISFTLPYVANVYNSYPDTDNLYPELIGQFNWTMKIGSFIDESYDDMYVTYDMQIEELATFPQIKGETNVDVEALHNATDPTLNYSISMTNTGSEMAHNVTFVWDLEGKPEPHYISIFNSEEYMFNATIQKYYNQSTGLLLDDPQWNTTLSVNILITGWFTDHEGTIVQPVTTYNTTSKLYDIDYEASLASVYINKSFFTFNHSSNLYETTLENGNFALYGTVDTLDTGSSESFWWSISDLPGQDDTFIILGWDPSVNTSASPLEFNVTFVDNTSAYGVGNNLADYVVQEALSKGEDLRHPTLIENPEFLPGVMFRYADNASREYFGWSNGLVVQLYDDEAILKTTVSLNSSIYKIDDVAQIDVLIENIGDANATNIFIQGYHAQLGPDWELIDHYEFSEVTPIDPISPGKNATHTFMRNVSTFLGLHPVAIGFTYTTEESEGFGGVFNRTQVTGLASNLILGLILPKDDKSGEDEPSYPAPVVNVSVTWNDENEGDITQGDLVEIQTEVTNLGDETTTIKLFSYFPSRMATIDPYAQYYDGKNFKVTDISGNPIDPDAYDQGFALLSPDWPICVAAVAGLHLAPGATIVFYYKLIVENASALIIPPVSVEYDSRYPMAGASGMEGASGGGGEPSPFSLHMAMSDGSHNLRLSVQAAYATSTWTSYSSSSLLAAYAAVTPTTTAVPTTQPTGVEGYTTLTSFIRDNMRLMIVVLAIPVAVLVIRERRRRQ